MTLFVAVHVGAGHLSRSKESKYRSICARACEEAMKLLKQGESALEAVSKAIVILEDDPITNAGYGSNLTLKCTVECDASVMDGGNLNFGAVGAVSGIKNPILAAQKMAQQTTLLPLGRIPPTLLVGPGAKVWAGEQGLTLVGDDALLSQDSINTYGKHIRLLYQESSHDDDDDDDDEGVEEDKLDDTVGAIAIDGQGNVAAGVSSGGISLKYPGRVGEAMKAAMYGCGCWAKNATENEPAIACSTSGTGEQIMRTRITMQCVEQLETEDDIPSCIARILRKNFIDSPYLQMYDVKSVGIIILRAVKSEQENVNHPTEYVEFCFAHTTDSMGIGCMSENSRKPKTFISRKAAHEATRCSGWLVG
ncbi:threonine aspartase 1-like protein [Phascolomyces articulosus]|uniref:Threonine aspartase 1-like protein n=1 Tax=Phascolomyces articulosus TaxID=60185 RepID=A0AAD5K3L1_9FUNG|nr:threonine aspartase 1-like protein [Phascolomyces articulosus]